MTALEAMKQMGIKTPETPEIKEVLTPEKKVELKDIIYLLNSGATVDQINAVTKEQRREVVSQLQSV